MRTYVLRGETGRMVKDEIDAKVNRLRKTSTLE